MKLNLQLIKDEKDNKEYVQNFPNGKVCFWLSKTPTSVVFNHCYVELFIDEINQYQRKYRVFDSDTFRTEEAFERGIKWVEDIITLYDKVIMFDKKAK